MTRTAQMIVARARALEGGDQWFADLLARALAPSRPFWTAELDRRLATDAAVTYAGLCLRNLDRERARAETYVRHPAIDLRPAALGLVSGLPCRPVTIEDMTTGLVIGLTRDGRRPVFLLDPVGDPVEHFRSWGIA